MFLPLAFLAGNADTRRASTHKLRDYMMLQKAAEPQRRQKGIVREWFDVREKPVGGFARLSSAQVLLIAWAWMAGLVTPFEFRLFWAAVEVKARREAASRVRDAHETVINDFGSYAEWAGLLGKAGGEKRARRAFRRLKRLGLLSCSKSELRFIESPDELRVENISNYWEFVKRVGKAASRAQPIPIPRSMVRLMAGGVSKAVALTMLGVVLRCLRRRKLNGSWACVSGGLISAAWVAETFELGVATAKHAFKHLRSLNWLSRLETPQWVQQRHGAKTLINLNWGRPAQEGSESTPLMPEKEALSTPPNTETRNSLLDRKTRNPERPDQTGFSTEKGGEKKPPTLKHLELSDLRSTKRLLSIFEQAVDAGTVGGGDGARLSFCSAAEHALVKGTKNPCGLFMHIVKNKLWHYCTNDDEDAAHERLKRHFYGATRKREREDSAGFRSKRVEFQLSDDAKLVAAVQRVAVQHRIASEPFYLLKRERPEWTRERWDAAVGELEKARFQRFTASHGEREFNEVEV